MGWADRTREWVTHDGSGRRTPPPVRGSVKRRAMEILVARDDAAAARVGDPALLMDWGRLQISCPWSTTFQSAAFVAAWYGVHHESYEPVLVEGRDADGRLVGFLALARNRAGQHLVGAGDIHAEYQGWIAEPAASEAFIRAAIQELERSFPRGRLRFNYLAPGTPVTWIHRDRAWPRQIQLGTRQRGLLDLTDVAVLDASLRKGHNRSRLNHLRRIGDVRLESIDSVDGLDAVIDEIAVLCDLRQGAINNSLPFRRNPYKRPFHLALMERGLLRVTVLRVGREIASAHLDMRNGDEDLIYLIAHAPAFARDSPGSLHILLLARELAIQGVARYDLSPGSGYKDRYATEHQPVHRMTASFGVAGRFIADVSARTIATATKALATVGRTPIAAQADVLRTKARIVDAVTQSPRENLPEGRALILRLTGRGGEPAGEALALDRLGDLLAYAPARRAGLPTQRFLQLALHRLELGHRVLTRIEDGKLAECWWVRSVGAALSSADPAMTTPPTSALLLYDPLVAAPDGADTAARLVDRLGHAAQGVAPDRVVYLAVPAREGALGAALVSAGAVPVGEVVPSGARPPVDAVSNVGSAAAVPLREITEALAAGWPRGDRTKA